MITTPVPRLVKVKEPAAVAEADGAAHLQQLHGSSSPKSQIYHRKTWR